MMPDRLLHFARAGVSIVNEPTAASDAVRLP
jgi:hypothetical protein